jgi:indole-3-glycerol phosphate synthase
MADILEKIVETTRENLGKRRKKVAQSDFKSFKGYEFERRSLSEALTDNSLVSVIAEIKKASPSKGVIRPDFNPSKLASVYQKGGASALSVLTDEPYFQGQTDFLMQAREHAELPILRKDFIIDPYQIEEARAYGADAVLLIASVLEGSQLQELQHAADEAGLEALVECYEASETDRIDFRRLKLLGVNNRDLKDFSVDLHRGVEILNSVETDAVKISESGLSQPEDLLYLHKNRIDSALIGEHFMRQSDPGEAVNELLIEQNMVN